METIKRYLANPIVTGVLGLLVGVFIGLVILGWWLTPVEWTDAAPDGLRPDAKVNYLRACIDAYGYNGDAARAKACYESLGEGAADALAEIVNNPAAQDSKLVAAYGNLALEGQGLAAEGQPGAEGQPVEGQPAVESQPEAGATAFPLEEPTAETEEGGGTSWFVWLCGGGLLILAAVAAYFLLNRYGLLPIGKGKAQDEGGKGSQEAQEINREAPPISRNIASYMLGNDLFDEVYSIEAGGEFLGEYGVAIADSSGVGGPKKVSAFEVWLFDKANIPTTTKVLMSEQAYADPARRQKLAAKGDVVQVRPNQQVVLETENLQLVANIMVAEYTEGAAGNFFNRFVLELKVWQLEAA